MNQKILDGYLQSIIGGKPYLFPVTNIRVLPGYTYIEKAYDVTNMTLWKINEICTRYGMKLEVRGKRNLIIVSEIFMEREPWKSRI